MRDDNFKTYAAIACAVLVVSTIYVIIATQPPAPSRSVITPASPLLGNNPCVTVRVLPYGPTYVAEEVKVDKKNNLIIVKINKYRTITLSAAQGNVQIDNNPVNCIGSYY